MNDSGEAAILQSGMIRSSSPSRSVPISSPSPTAVGVGVNGGGSYILHTVSKFDTLAGVAIKYGVEISDVKRLNGLVTDLQMFARKTLHIPLPGRHPPSPSNGGATPPRPSNSPRNMSNRRQSNLFDSFPSLKLKAQAPSEQTVSPAMSRLQGFQMAVNQKEGVHSLADENTTESSSISDPSQSRSQQRKSKSTANLLASENGNLMDQVHKSESIESDKSIENLVRRRQKSEADFASNTPDKVLKEDMAAFSAITGKGLALRPKFTTRTVSGGVDGEAGGGLNPIPIGLGDSIFTTDDNAVQKLSSASSDSDNGSLSSIWASSTWSLKNKAALD